MREKKKRVCGVNEAVGMGDERVEQGERGGWKKVKLGDGLVSGLGGRLQWK